MTFGAEVDDLNGLIEYLRSIDWSDPLFLYLFSFHATVTLASFNTRNHSNFQIVLFFALLLLVFFSENINEYARAHDGELAAKYFDSKGLFISLVFSVPILLNCMMMVGCWLYQSTQLAENLRKAQLKKMQNQNKREEVKEKST